MKLPLRTLAVLTASTALIVGAQAVPTQATSPGKIAVGGVDTVGTNAASGTNVGNLTFMSDAAVPMSCTNSSITGSVNRGASVVAGATIGTISDLDFTGCEATALDYPVTMVSKGTWAIKVVGNPAPETNTVNIEIANVTAQVKSTGAAPLACDYEATGTVPGTFNVSTQRITIASTAFPLNLQAFDGTGTNTAAATTCGGDVWAGDKANMNGIFSLFVAGGDVTVAAGTVPDTGKVTVGGVDTVGINAASATNVGNVTFMSDAGVPSTCTGSSVTGTVNRGTPVINGATIGEITNLSFTGCTMTDFLYPLTIFSKGTWAIKVVGNPAPKSNIVNIEIANVIAQVKSTGSAPLACDYEATGTVPGTFNVSTQRITIASTAFPLNLQAFDGTGTETPALQTCAGEVVTGDKVNMNGIFSFSVTGGALSF